MQTSEGTPPPPPAVPPPPGWYADPWGEPRARWWNGAAWEQLHTTWVEQSNRREARRPWARFRGWWITIGVAAVLVAPAWLSGIFSDVLTIPLWAASGLALVAALWWLDRIEPEPIDVLVLCVAWGATVAAAVAGELNALVADLAGETAATVVSAPLGEEALKGVILIVLVRRRMIDSMIDGAVYAIAVAIGFSLTEDLVYYDRAADSGTAHLLMVYLGRGVFGLFSHPLFTVWMGVAAGFVVTRRPAAGTVAAIATGSYLLAAALHALWNGTLVVAEQLPEALWLVGILFAVLLAATIVLLVGLRRAQSRRFDAQVPALASLLSMHPAELAVFASTRDYLRYRRSLPRARRADLGRLRWTLHAIAVLRTVPPRTSEQMRADSEELGQLRGEADELRRYLFPGSPGVPQAG